MVSTGFILIAGYFQHLFCSTMVMLITGDAKCWICSTQIIVNAGYDQQVSKQVMLNAGFP